MSDQQDERKSQREAFQFLRERFREDKPFTKADLAKQVGWSEKSISTYWSKQFQPFLQLVPPILKGAQKKYRVTDVFLTVGTWPKFCRHVSQKRCRSRIRHQAAAGGIVKLRLKAVFDVQHGGFATGLSPVSWGSIDELFVNLTIPTEGLR